MDSALLPGGTGERNQRGAGGSGQATPPGPPEGCAEPGQAPAAGCCCVRGGSGHCVWDCDCACAGRTVTAVGGDSSFGLATTLGFGLGFAFASGLGSAGVASAVG